MPNKLDKIPINNEGLDRRVKLTQEQKLEILGFKGVKSQRELARMYNVSRRTIQFILDPEKLVANKEARKIRGGTAQYYDKEAHAKSMNEHRKYKKELFNKGLITDENKTQNSSRI